MSDKFSFLKPTFDKQPAPESVTRISMDQIHYYIDELQRLADRGESLQDEENYPYVVAPLRVVNMLHTLEDLLKRKQKQNWLEKLKGKYLLEPIKIGGVMTAPVLLVIQAILHSHAGWGEAHFHDLHTAACVCSGEKGKINTYLSEAAALWPKVAALIAFQHVIRASVFGYRSEPEVFILNNHGSDYALRSGFEKINDTERQATAELDQLCDAFARAMDSLWGADSTPPKVVYAAMMAMNLVTDRRKKGPPQGEYLKPWQRKLDQFKQIFKNLISKKTPNNNTSCPLVVLSYGRYYLDDKKDTDKFKGALAKAIAGKDPGKGAIHWMSLPRLPSGQMIAEMKKNIIKTQGAEIIVTAKFNGLENICGNVISLRRISPDIVINCIIGAKYNAQQPRDIWELTRSSLAKRLRKHPENINKNRQDPLYVPVPMVHSVLKMLYDFMESKEQFVKLVVTKRWSHHVADAQSRGWPSGAKCIYLPKKAPTLDMLDTWKKDNFDGKVSRGELGPSTENESLRLIVARAAAAFILNETMAFGSDQVSVELDPPNEGWWQAIRLVMGKNGHKVLETFHDFYCGLPASRAYNEGKCEPRECKYFLGIDVGGTEVKWEIFTRDSDGPVPDQDKWEYFPTDPASWQRKSNRIKYADARDFALRVKESVKNKFGDLPHFDLISVSWCGAVRQAGTKQIVAAPSKIMGFFDGFSGEIDKNDLVRFHNFGLVTAFEEAFKNGENITPIVYLTNDGTAHVEGRQIGAEDDDLNVALVAGTGLACGVRRGKTCLPLLAEVGKMIIDVGCEFGSSYPKGVAREHFSKNTLPGLYKRAIGGANGAPVQVLLPLIGVVLADMDNWSDPSCSEWKGRAKEKLEDEIKSLLSGVEEVRHLCDDWPKNFYESTCNKLKGTLEGMPWKLPKKADTSIKEILKDCGVSGGTKVIEDFFLYLTYLAAARAADLAALLYDTYGIRQITLTGGPMKGAIGTLVEKFTRSLLKSQYYFDIECKKRKNIREEYEDRHTVRCLELATDEGVPDKNKPEYHAAYGAVMLAHKWLKSN